MVLGYTALVLHAHLPFVRHPDGEDYLEERWLFEAITECYLPILQMLEGLEYDRVPFRVTISFSPTLMAMLDDPLLRSRYRGHLEAGVALAEREVARAGGGPESSVAHFYRNWLGALHTAYTQRYRQDLLAAFHRLATAGYVELITCCATHGFLPVLQQQPEMVKAQIEVAVHEFRRRFGHAPRGFWLPECGYFPGVDGYLRRAGIQYCFVETHAMDHARPWAPRGAYAHGWTPGGVAVFGRDALSSKQVWSAESGYPGHGSYREFYRDIGWERDPEYLGKLAGPNGIRVFSGFKYHRVTGRTDQKELYDRWFAERTAEAHADHFVSERARQVAELRAALPGDPPPLIVAPYDAELFGHWWFEGPFWMEQVARRAAQRGEFRFITPGDYLDLYPQGQGALEPDYSSWGYQGYADLWVGGANHWMYRHLFQAGKRMVEAARRHHAPGEVERRALNQAARELLLAQASDWPFILQTGTSTDYARRRFQQHIGRFQRIETGISGGSGVNPTWLAQIEAADNLFPEIDFRLFAQA